jgi:AAA15 family ATPase/GTPase
MIKKIHIPETAMLHKFFAKDIHFTEGVNVIYGQNGTGKSLLLNTLAHNTFIHSKGWSKPISNLRYTVKLWDFDINNYLTFKDSDYDNNEKLWGECTIDWDGIAAFKTEGIISKKFLNDTISHIMCGCKNKEDISYEQMQKIRKENLSSGQTAKIYVDNLLSLEVPDLSIDKCANKWDLKDINLLANHVSTLSLDGKPTLLIDEIDGYFDFDNLYHFWNVSIEELVKKYQIIIVTHNPFFIKKSYNIIGVEYYEKSMNMLKSLNYE